MDEEDSQRIERLLATFRFAIRDDLDGSEHEILNRIREVEDSLEVIAREMARKGGQGE